MLLFLGSAFLIRTTLGRVVFMPLMSGGLDLFEC